MKKYTWLIWLMATALIALISLGIRGRLGWTIYILAAASLISHQLWYGVIRPTFPQKPFWCLIGFHRYRSHGECGYYWKDCERPGCKKRVKF